MPIDVFISYSHEDQTWVGRFAEDLRNHHLEVFLDDWSIGIGDVVVTRLEEGVREAGAGVLVLSPSAISSGWVIEEYAALLRSAVEGNTRLIPVLIADVSVPEFLANRRWVDFRSSSREAYRKGLELVVAAIRAPRE